MINTFMTHSSLYAPENASIGSSIIQELPPIHDLSMLATSLKLPGYRDGSCC